MTLLWVFLTLARRLLWKFHTFFSLHSYITVTFSSYSLDLLNKWQKHHPSSHCLSYICRPVFYFCILNQPQFEITEIPPAVHLCFICRTLGVKARCRGNGPEAEGWDFLSRPFRNLSINHKSLKSQKRGVDSVVPSALRNARVYASTPEALGCVGTLTSELYHENAQKIE